MKKLYLLLLISGVTAGNELAGQYLSNLQATHTQPVYTTYAAPIGRSEYILNQAYHLRWYDRTKSFAFESRQGGSISFAFRKGKSLKTRLEEFHQWPVVTASYPDLVKFNCLPFQDISVEVSFIVYSSRQAMVELKVENLGITEQEIEISPYFYFDDKGFNGLTFDTEMPAFWFRHNESPDNWMKSQQIPFQEELLNLMMFDRNPDSWAVYQAQSDSRQTPFQQLFNDLSNNALPVISNESGRILATGFVLRIQPGEEQTLRMVRSIAEPGSEIANLIESNRRLINTEFEKFIRDNEALFSAIPKLHFTDPKYEALYWNAFSLIRQCMLPPEGECGYNYYVFSREPRWGWGYGGQVFHESLVMLAYAFMDPMSAMNSQRIFIERQRDDGFINYRTGPYLNETIVTNGQPTTSAPWYNWINYELYKITRDKIFLAEAYESGKRFYEYVLTNRDSDGDGLCEWGGHAVLESVRDARVAVWDQVGDPSNFEALDMNLMLVNEAKALASMAHELGAYEDSKRFSKQAEQRAQLINKYMWDSETGFYYHVNKNDHSFTFRQHHDLKRQEIIAFLALWAGVPDSVQAARLMQHLLNPDKFWRRFGVPTLSAGDPYYNPIGYWNGPVWVQWQYLIFRGLLDYGYHKEAEELVMKVADNIAHHLCTKHWFWEFYSADDLQAGWNKTYIWTGIIARFFIDLQNLDSREN